MNLTAIYAGTFDPITNGHADLIQRASKLFDRVVVAVAESARKKPTFSLETRMQLVQAVLTSFKNVEFISFSGLLVDVAKAQKAQVILRGLRAVSDFDYEFQLYGTNHKLSPEIETIFLPASEGTAYVSASLVREIAAMGGEVSAFVAPVVAKKLREKSWR